MARERRRIEWERLMGTKAWMISEIQPKLGLSYRSTRRYLKRSYESRRLEMVKLGRYKYFAVARFLDPPDYNVECTECGEVMYVFKCKCGCEFSICHKEDKHSVFKYCKRHISS